MKERGILMSGMNIPPIQADIKTHTRRIMNPQPIYETTSQGIEWFRYKGQGFTAKGMNMYLKSRYGQPGDRLWVKETWAHHVQAIGAKRYEDGPFVYAADGEFAEQYRIDGKWKPAIFMPRWASRILLEITEIRVERLQDISEADAIAEDAVPSIVGTDLDYLKFRAGYHSLWETINGSGSWSENPFVWVIIFRRIK